MGFDRSKYKAASFTDIKKQQETHEQVRPSNSNNDVHELKPGDNWFRIAPFHPDKGGVAPWEPKCVSFLDVKQQKRDENKRPIEGQFEVRAKPIFNSRVHLGLEKDLVEEYMKVAKEIAIPNFTDDKKVQENIWKKLTAFDPVKKKSGIKPVDTWECYAWNESGKLATLSLKKTMYEGLNILVTSAAGDGPVTTDPFSDIEYGIPIIIKKIVGAKDIDTKYVVSFAETSINNGKGQITKTTEPKKLTDTQLQQFDKVKSLYERFVNSFTRKDFDFQIEGLESAERKLKEDGYDISVMSYNQFLDSAEEISAQLPEETPATGADEEQQPAAPVAVEKKPAPQPARPNRPQPKVSTNVPIEETADVAVAEEEVKEPIVPRNFGRKTVNAAKSEAPQGAHIDATQSALDRIRNRTGRK